MFKHRLFIYIPFFIFMFCLFYFSSSVSSLYCFVCEYLHFILLLAFIILIISIKFTLNSPSCVLWQTEHNVIYSCALCIYIQFISRESYTYLILWAVSGDICSPMATMTPKMTKGLSWQPRFLVQHQKMQIAQVGLNDVKNVSVSVSSGIMCENYALHVVAAWMVHFIIF